MVGSNVTVDVDFVRATVPVTFDLLGLPSGTPGQVRLSNMTQVGEASSFVFQIPNSTFRIANGTIHLTPKAYYTFDIAPPAGYYASPEGGNVTVHGPTSAIEILILPIGRGPNPGFLSLVLPAATAATALGLSCGGMFALLGAIRRRRTGATL